jgi:hypothetical protein|tara:strand:+ start:5064 stop:5318 length:255 start_codon:yes stop_codon:yes gene_type:complete
MTEAWGIIVAALVTGSFGVLGIFLRRFRYENQRDHADVANRLKGLVKSIADVKVSVDSNGERLTDHLDWHVKEKPPRRKPAAKK